MQKDLDRLLRRKRRMRRLFGVLGLTVAVALLIAGVHSCRTQFQEPYNKDYRPLDSEPQKVMEP
ncbi:MAG: hypothetical protein K9M17_02010 [Mariprofundaceae bacterium]|nr:hypothetical protein [Mariprofundaceae bacterium]